MDVLSSRILIRPRDHEASITFYRDTLGLAIYYEFPGGTVFFLGQGFLEVVGDGGTGSGDGLSVWIQVRDLDAELAALAGRGLAPDREARLEPWGLYEAWVSDPEGTKIILVEIPQGHPLRTDLRTGIA
ncbi:VOC family protein [Amycolatopsis sp. H20-H5]|uniref:VOC family protein n=1 Tax=Amycolatopsis sp. H20-H5 TaxID=3046309 RepID=UPI002DBEB461|nr:VOC family protein [Amycolatopsis sp. H20-H5]MEC3977269.1 VOC family protein [Amycolatopsis sp. H20-H5]